MPIGYMHKIQIGEIYGFWTIVELPYREDNYTKVLCKCACGTPRRLRLDRVVKFLTISCGCANGKKPKSPPVKHGMSRSPEYKAWADMVQRCTNPAVKQYRDYGGRGIKVFPGWLTNFIQFYRQLGPKPSPKHSLDRIDNQRGYEPSNVIWAKWAQQSRNRRSNIWVIYQGERITLGDACIRSNMEYRGFMRRVKNPNSIFSALGIYLE